MDIAKIGSPEEEIKHNILNARNLSSRDISRAELGSSLGFNKAEETKSEICEYIIDILSQAQKHEKKMNAAALDQALKTIAGVLKHVSSNADKIEMLVIQSLHTEEFPKQREQLIAEISNQLVTVKQQLHTFELDLKLSNIEELLSREHYFSEIKVEAEEHLNATKAVTSKVEKILENLRNKTVLYGLDESQSHFGSLKVNHRRFERAWFWAFIIAYIAATVIVYLIYSLDPPEALNAVFGVELLQRMLLLSAAGVGMRLCLTKYNTERKLRIVYEHREKVFDQYRTFEAGIGDDSQAKNEFRLEIAKYIFSDPKSGYDENSTVGTEINLNPVFNAVEGFVKR